MSLHEALAASLAALLGLAASAQGAEEGDTAQGEKLFNRCKICHTIEAGAPHRVGPNLHGVFGREAGGAEGYNYSKAMQESDVVWNAETISQYTENPREFIPGNKMAFPGLKKEEDRQDLIAYLKQATQ